MNRREFLGTSVGCALSLHAGQSATGSGSPDGGSAGSDTSVRSLFPRLEQDVYLNAARGTPLGRFAEEVISFLSRDLAHLTASPTRSAMDRAGVENFPAWGDIPRSCSLPASVTLARAA